MEHGTFLRGMPGEDEPRGVAAPLTPRPAGRWRVLVAAVALGLLLLAFLPRWRAEAGRAASEADAVATAGEQEATLVIETQPAGWHVWDGEVDRGVTPLTVTLPPGRRTLSLRRGPLTRQLDVDLAAGSRSVHHLEIGAVAPTLGDLRVETIPPGATVAVDGIGRGVTPADVRDLKAGPHVVTILAGDRVISQKVTVQPGAIGSVIVPLAEKGAPAVGWLAVKSAVDLEVFEGDSLVGSSRNHRLLFMPGRHALRFVNRELGVEVEKAVDVQPGASVAMAVPLPNGRVSVNAMPWAEVLLDGVRIGETPIAGYQAAVGPHELTFRHPTLGERRHSIVVTTNRPVRLGVDLRQ